MARPVRVRLFADHRQIHLREPDARGDLEEAWTAKASDDRIAAAGDIVAFGTEAADDVDVTLEVAATEPERAPAEHQTEASIAVRTGTLALLGCTDYVPDAKTIRLAAGTWRVRASHTNLGKRERIRLQLWPGRARKPAVLVRWTPPAPVRTTLPARPKNREQAVEAALRGQTDGALDVLLELHRAGDAAASAAAAEILAFQGRWKELVPCAKALLAKPNAVYAGNVIDDMKALLARAQNKKLKAPARAKPERARFAEAVATAESGKRFKGKPRELAAHCFALAVVMNVDDEIIARWDPQHPHMHFDQAVEYARALLRRGDRDRAWAAIEGKLGAWYPVDAAQVVPVVLLCDAALATLMTAERCKVVLHAPKAGHP